MYLIAFLIIGFTSGGLANFFVGGRGLGGALDILVGTAGAFVGGFFLAMLGVKSFGFWGPIIASAIGSILFLSFLALSASAVRTLRH